MTSPDHPGAPFEERVARHLQQGGFGRAKEILRNRLEPQPVDLDALEQLDCVLLQMRDQLEAGRYLVLAGKEPPAYQPPIHAFLARTRGMDLHAFSSLCTAPLRRTRIADQPCAVREELLRYANARRTSVRRLRASAGLTPKRSARSRANSQAL